MEITIFTQCDEVLKQSTDKHAMECETDEQFRSSLPDNTNRHALYSHTRCLGLHSPDVRYIVIIQGYGISD